MITSNQIINICEKYADTFNVNNNIVELVSNPTISELKDLRANTFIRFIADPKKQLVYFWDSSKAVHYVIAERLQISHRLDVLCGEAKFSGNSMPTMFQADSIEYFVSNIKNNMDKTVMLSEVFESDWNWLNKYVSGVSKYIDTW